MSNTRSLTEKIKFGLGWSALENIASQGLGFGIQMLLARLVAPKEFGLLALLAIFIEISHIIIDGGLTHAVIQKKTLSRRDSSTVFFSNLALSAMIYGLIFLAAPSVSQFFDEPRLTLLMRILGLNLIISAAGKIQQSLIIRNLDFKKLFQIRTPSIVLGGIAGVILAFQGFGVWALVCYQITMVLFSTACFWFFAERELWPRWEFSFSSLKTMGRFGIGLVGSGLVFQGTQNLYGILIAKSLSFDQLAFYNRARTFHRAPTSSIAMVLGRVLLPVFSTIQDDDKKIVAALRKGVPVIAFTVFPLMAWLMCVSDEIVVLLLTEQWLPAAHLMRWFPIIGMLTPISSVLLSVITAKGRTGLFFWLDVLKTTVALSVLIATLQHGVLAIVIGQVLVSIFSSAAINMPAGHWVFGYRVKDQLADLCPYFAAVGLAATICISASFYSNFETRIGMLAFRSAVFFTTYTAICYRFRLHGTQELTYASRMLGKTIHGLTLGR